MENTRRSDGFILIALLLSIGLHSGAIGFLPGFGTRSEPPITPPLTIELVIPEPPPPPPLIKEPEPPKPEVKPEPKPVPQPPKPIPVQKTITPEPPPAAPQTEAPPPAPEAAKPVEPTPQPVIAVEQKTTELPPTNTVSTPVPAPVATQEPNEDRKGAVLGYGNQLSAEMSKNQTYPTRAYEKRWTGKGRILLKYDAKTKKFSYAISQPSARAILDQAAMQNLQRALDVIQPSELINKASFEVEIPFVYRLETSQ